MRWLQHFDRSCNPCLDCGESQDRLRKQRKAAQQQGWEMNIWDKGLGICSSSVPLQSHLVKQLKHRVGRVSFRVSSSLQGGFVGDRMIRVVGREGPQQPPGSCAGGRELSWPGAAFPAHLETTWRWAQAGAGPWLHGMEVEGSSEAQPCLGAGEAAPSEAALDTP